MSSLAPVTNSAIPRYVIRNSINPVPPAFLRHRLSTKLFTALFYAAYYSYVPFSTKSNMIILKQSHLHSTLHTLKRIQMDAVMRPAVRLHGQSVLIRTYDRGMGVNSRTVGLMRELVMERVANLAEICLRIWVFVVLESSESLVNGLMTNEDITADNKLA